ncbi:hypothetical protein NC981_09245 [Leptolyngbya sp. DQ-M1]|uniref:hypothetical protein n=1 Tax=Leptolyngbya sp. DQ-M1 TaxID=2933920 RepID=UPI00329A3A13
MPKTMTRTNQKRLLACCSDGQHIYLVYRHGNPKDVFRGLWLTTDPEIKECSDYDFRVDRLIEGFESKINAIWKVRNAEHYGIVEEAAIVLHRLEQAIKDGKIKFPPDSPGEWQSGSQA